MNTAVTVSSQLLRALCLLHNCQLTVLVYAPPAPHRGVDNARPVPFEAPSVPGNPRHNIIRRDCVTSRRERRLFPLRTQSGLC